MISGAKWYYYTWIKNQGFGLEADLENLKTLMEWDIIFDNCWWQWLIFIAFLIIAIVMRKSDNKLRRRSGNVLLCLGIPGAIYTLITLGMFAYISYLILSFINPETHVLNDIKLHDAFDGYDYYRFVNAPFAFMPFSLLLIAVQSIAAFISGILVLRKGKGKAIGIAAIVFGLAITLFAVVYLWLVLKAVGDP